MSNRVLLFGRIYLFIYLSQGVDSPEKGTQAGHFVTFQSPGGIFGSSQQGVTLLAPNSNFVGVILRHILEEKS